MTPTKFSGKGYCGPRNTRNARKGTFWEWEPDGSFEVVAFKGLLLKGSYWRWLQRNLGGNAIDFFVQVLGLSFAKAMTQITAP